MLLPFNHPRVPSEEAHHILCNLRKTRVDWLGTHMHEHMTHILDQDELSLVPSCEKLVVELN